MSALYALVRIRLGIGVEPARFEEHLRDEASVADAWRVAGDFDYEVRLSCRTITDLDAVVTDIRHAGADQTTTSLVLHRVESR